MQYKVIIPAAGMGKRMGYGRNKLFIPIRNVPIVVHTMTIFEKDEWCDEIILVINEKEREEIERHIKTYGITKVGKIINGGRERQQSVFAGLETVEGDEEIVLIHDGARPMVKIPHIHQLVVEASREGAAVLGVPVKDTIKKVQNGIVMETIDRAMLWAIQTPQAFRLSVIKSAHELAERDRFLGTDDASLVERIGKKVKIIEGDYENIKITTKEDLLFAESLLLKKE
ncbi:2-C-methyl-D-erythritol 4-phosphate cytidylyltransferase [Fervidibacillus halotolerans]|uniref:2-C-methyl-D-erythritol 4-phosphate cytidylyltransferase n=1 Tax=Fervidibacillus halotolerans TaxID=2980027 RepID=A0A9E8LZ33_9BACI|nr:2-C-methyl-D-erythritol 4-phosphate cytidylyltransferase [Fervidibacillus halotolerans]WAA12370.1 2-C-methyl-D-erythritol 4-phosphate cytidylyltransferase [Fervidibacillus halotolerans]